MRAPRPSSFALASVAAALAVLAASGAPVSDAHADAIPEGVRGLRYRMTIANLASHQRSWVFVVYPTTNSGYGYVLEPGIGLTQLMMRASWRGEASRLHAVPRAAFAEVLRTAPRHPHGDDDAMVQVVPEPSRSVVASAEIAPPAPVPEGSTEVALERTFRIASLSMRRFDLQLVSEVLVHRDGRREERAPRARPLR